MSRGVGLALLVVGVILLIFGINASNSVGSDLSNLFTGQAHRQGGVAHHRRRRGAW
jgi:hypothetical protein